MNIDIQTVKPRAMFWRGHWWIRCPLANIVYFGTFDEALSCWRAHRLHTQHKLPRWCK